MSTYNGFYIQPVSCQLFYSLNFSKFLRKTLKVKILHKNIQNVCGAKNRSLSVVVYSVESDSL